MNASSQQTVKPDRFSKNLNTMMALNFICMFIMFIKIMIDRHCIDFTYELKIELEFIFQFILLIPILMLSFLVVKTMTKFNTSKFIRIFRYTLQLVLILWYILTLISEQRIAINEIAMAFYMFFLIELIFVLKQKIMLDKTASTLDLKHFHLAGFVNSAVLMAYLYFIMRFDSLSLEFFIILFIRAIYFSLISINIFLIGILLRRK